MEHSPECKKQQIVAACKQTAWKKRWPNFCQKCNGYGGIICDGSHPYGPTYAQENDPCKDCAGSQSPHCPRCSMPWTDDLVGDLFDGFLDCPGCGWDWNNNDDGEDVLPPNHECFCTWRDVL